jgi:ArsR family transcriptional regulator
MTVDTVVELQSPSAGTPPRFSGVGGVGLAELANSLKMLCEHNRMRILCFLMQGERGVCDLADCLDLPQNLVSHHLGVLRELGLVTPHRDEQDARCIHYSVDRTALAQLNALYLSFFTPERVRPWRLDCCSAGECCPECRATGMC